MSQNNTDNTTEDTTPALNDGKKGDEEEVETEDMVQKELSTEEADEVVEEETLEQTSDKKTKLPEFRAGDTVRVYYKIIEGDKTRIQPYEGIVIAKKGKGESRTFTVRRIGADNVGVERIFPVYSPNITKLEVKKLGRIRRAKLYYLRDKKGRAAIKVKERKAKTVSKK